MLTALDVEKATVGILLHFRVIYPFFSSASILIYLKKYLFAAPVCQALWCPGRMMVGKHSHGP